MNIDKSIGLVIMQALLFVLIPANLFASEKERLFSSALSSYIKLAYCDKPVSGFSEREFTVYNNEDNITLGATLTAPDTPKAGIVLATGSGPHNRDEEIGKHKPFKLIAEYLADRGYAVLRMDDRGVGKSSGNFNNAINDDFVSDIAAGILYLDSCYSGIPIGVIGHSEGGTTAIKSAVRNENCDFIITLAAAAWQGDSIIMSQTRAITTAAMGRWDTESLQRKCLDIAKSDIPEHVAEEMLLSIIDRNQKAHPNRSPQMYQQIEDQIPRLLSPWYRNFLQYNPEEDIKAVHKPWLAINGELDCQVLPGNLNTIKKLNSSAETVLLPHHNHLFQECTTGTLDEYLKISSSISQLTLETICTWLDKIFANKQIITKPNSNSK